MRSPACSRPPARGPTLRGLPGPRRALLYRLALTTGLRAGELASLTASSFDLDADPPTVRVEAAHSKHRRVDVLPLRRDVAGELSQLAADPLFPGSWPSRPVAILKPDLESARIPYRTPAGVFDFHSLRHQFISDLAQSGVHPKIAQTLEGRPYQCPKCKGALRLRGPAFDFPALGAEIRPPAVWLACPDCDPNLWQALGATAREGDTCVCGKTF